MDILKGQDPAYDSASNGTQPDEDHGTSEPILHVVSTKVLEALPESKQRIV